MTKRVRRLLLLGALALVFVVGSAQAIGFFLIPLVMGCTVSLIMGVGAAQEMAMDDVTPTQVGQQVVQVRFTVAKEGGASGVYQLPAKVGGVLPKAPVAPEGVGSYSNPILWTDASVRVRVSGGGSACKIRAGNSRDGYDHYLTAGVYTPAELVTACNQHIALWTDALAFYGYPVCMYPSYPDPDPYPMGPYRMGDRDYYVAPFRVFGYDDGWGDGCSSGSNPGELGSGLLVELVEPQDGVKRFAVAAAGISVDRTDPDWTDQEKADSDTAGTGSVVVTGGGQTTQAAVVDGAVVVGRSSNQGASVVTKIIYVSNVGAVSGMSESNTPGSVETAGVPVAGAGGGSGGGGSTVQFPSDYSRQGEAGQAAKDLGDRLMQGQDLVDPTLPAAVDAFNNPSGSFDGLRGWRLPAHASQCPAPTFEAFGSTYAVDGHCEIVATHAAALSAAMVVVWSVAALFVVLRA